MAGLGEVLDNYEHHRELVFRHHPRMTSGKARTQETNKQKKQQRWVPANSLLMLRSNQPDFRSPSTPSATRRKAHASSDHEMEGLPPCSDHGSLPKAIPKLDVKCIPSQMSQSRHVSWVSTDLLKLPNSAKSEGLQSGP